MPFLYTCESNQLRKFHGDIYYLKMLPYSPVVSRLDVHIIEKQHLKNRTSGEHYNFNYNWMLTLSKCT